MVRRNVAQQSQQVNGHQNPTFGYCREAAFGGCDDLGSKRVARHSLRSAEPRQGYPQHNCEAA